MRNDSHREGVPDRMLILHPSGVRQSMRGDPVVYATLRPPATFCITLRVKYEKNKRALPKFLSGSAFSVYCLLLLLREAVAEFAGDDERPDHFRLLEVAVELVQLVQPKMEATVIRVAA